MRPWQNEQLAVSLLAVARTFPRTPGGRALGARGRRAGTTEPETGDAALRFGACSEQAKGTGFLASLSRGARPGEFLGVMESHPHHFQCYWPVSVLFPAKQAGTGGLE